MVLTENEGGGCGAPERVGGRGLRLRWNGGLAGETCPGAGWGEGGTQAGWGGDKGRGLLITIDLIWDRSVSLGDRGGIWVGFGRYA